MTGQNLLKWRHVQADNMLLCVRWYLCYALSYRDLEEMMLERGLPVDHTTIHRWVQHVAPERERRCRPHLKATTDSWRVDETSIKVKKERVSLSRAGDSHGKALDFFFSPMSDAKAAKQFLFKTLTASHSSILRVVNVDTNATSSKAFAKWKAEGHLPEHGALRHVKDLNTLVEQDHRFIKWLTKAGMGFFSFETAWRPIQRFEVMNMLRKGHLPGVAKGDMRGQVVLIAKLFGVVA